MAVNVVSFSSFGGAGNASTNLVLGFRRIGVDANLITSSRSNLRSNPLSSPGLTMSAAIDEYVVKHREFQALISLNRDKHSAIRRTLPDSELTIFRWMNGLLGDYFLRNNPELPNLVWGLDDMNPFTGVCHYSSSCRRFEAGCSNCPAVHWPFRERVRANMARKRQFATKHRPKYVAPTDWVYGEFKASQIGRDRFCTKIYNPLSARFFEKIATPEVSQKSLNVIVIAADLDDPTKGVWDIKDSANRFLKGNNTKLTMVGRFSRALSQAIPLATFAGRLNAEQIMECLRRSDALLVPSLFENSGTVVAEAASQGVPAIAREVGGMPEMTNYGETGFLFRTESQLDDILESVSRTDLRAKGCVAREWAQQFTPEAIANKYAGAFL